MISCNLIEIGLFLKDKHKHNFYKPTKEVLDSIKTTIKFTTINQNLPMICKPKLFEYSNNILKLGGYLSNDDLISYTPIIPKFNLRENSIIEKDNKIISLINNFSSIGFKINEEFLDLINFEKDLFFDSLINDNYIHPLSEKEKLTISEKQILESFKSKKALQNNILQIAKVYSKVNEFFIPTRIDFRGRIYCMSEYLNYQSTELAKALLLFSKPGKIHKTNIDCIKYLKIFGVNSYGNGIDKLSHNDKIKWLDENLYDILNFKNKKLIEKAENRFLFTSFCIEYKKWVDFLNNEETYLYTHFPIQLDASCNGYQHLALLSGDFKLGSKLNLTRSNWNDKPEDFYNHVLTAVFSYINENLKKESFKNEKDSKFKSYERLSKININRKIIKKSIMTIPYNASSIRLTAYIKEVFDYTYDENNIQWFYINDIDQKILFSDIVNLVKIIKFVLDQEFPRIVKLMLYLHEIATILTKLNIPIPWILPSGLNVKQSYINTKSVKINPFIFKKTSFTIKIVTQELNKAKQVRSFMPNLIHSLDATSIALMFENFWNINTNLYTVHDCFATTADKIEILIDLLKKTYISIYSGNSYLEKLHNHIILNMVDYLGKCYYNKEKNTYFFNNKEYPFPDINVVLGKNLKSDDNLNFLNYEELDSSYIIL